MGLETFTVVNPRAGMRVQAEARRFTIAARLDRSFFAPEG